MGKSKETYGKKEKEKKKLKHQQEKKLRTEERKVNKRDGNSLEGMMAYLDENGNLTDSPPDPSKKKVFRQEDIQITISNQGSAGESEFRTGVVIFFNHDKGFGFINDNITQERIFFHINDMLEQVSESDKVQYLVENGPRGQSARQLSRVV